MSRSFKCVDCSLLREYPSEAELEAHIAGDHLQMMVYSCELCQDAMFPTEFSIIQHYAKLHKMSSGFNLTVCYSEELREQRELLARKLRECVAMSDLPEAVDLTVPQLEETPIQPVRCLYCPGNMLYSTKESLEAHIATIHMKSAPWRCDLCDFAMFPTNFSLARHQSENHKGESGVYKLTLMCSPQFKQQQSELAEKLDMCLENTGLQEEKPGGDFLGLNDDVGDAEIRSSPSTQHVANGNDSQPNTRRSSEDPMGTVPNGLPTGSGDGNSDSAAGAVQNQHQGSPIPRVTKRPRVQCSMCLNHVIKSTMREHAVTHGNLVTFKCHVCLRFFKGLRSMEAVKKHMKSHVEKNESDDLNNFTDYRKELQDDINKLVKDCFP